MKIEYFGHACFKITEDRYSIVIDPYEKIRGFKDVNLSANEVICTHSHYDHAFKEGVIITLNLPHNPFEIEKIDCPHDEVEGAKRGRTDVVIFKANGKKVVHLGDLGVIPNKDVLAKISNADVLLIPVGGVYTIDNKEAKELIERVMPKVAIPMHYKKGEFGIDHIKELSEFTNLFPSVLFKKDNVIDTTEDLSGIVVLTPNY